MHYNKLIKPLAIIISSVMLTSAFPVMAGDITSSETVSTDTSKTVSGSEDVVSGSGEIQDGSDESGEDGDISSENTDETSSDIDDVSSSSSEDENKNILSESSDISTENTAEPTETPTPTPEATPTPAPVLFGDSTNINSKYYVREKNISAEKLPNAYSAVTYITDKGYSMSFACSVVGVLIGGDTGCIVSDIKVPDDSSLSVVLDDILDKLKESKACSGLADIESITSAFYKYYFNLSDETAEKFGYSSVTELTKAEVTRRILYAQTLFCSVQNAVVDKMYSYTSEDIRASYKRIEKEKYYIKNVKLSIYEEANASSAITGRALKGDLVYKLKECENNWYYIESGDVRGFVKRQALVSAVSDGYEGGESYSRAETVIPLKDNKAADFVTTTVYNFGTEASNELISASSDNYPAAGLSNTNWIKSLLYSFDIISESTADTGTVLSSFERDSDPYAVKCGYIVSYKPENTEDIVLYAVPREDGKFTTVDKEGRLQKETEIKPEQILKIYDLNKPETVHNIPYYCMSDFTDIAYDEDSVAFSGCGITSFSMLASYLSDSVISPRDAAVVAMDIGANTVKSWASFARLAAYYSVDAPDQHTGPLFGGSAQGIFDALYNGNIVIVSVTNGYFNPSGRGHYFILSGISDTGELYVNDPSTILNLPVPFSQDIVIPHVKQYWVFEV